MADEIVKEKIYCNECGGNSAPMWAALMSGRDNDNALMYNQMNNPMWLVWMMAMRWMYGNGDGYGGNAQLAQLQGQVADNQSFNSVLNALTQNNNAMQNIADRTNTNIDFVRQSLCSLGSAVQNVAGKTELGAERVINAINLGDSNIISQMLQCCCQNKLLVQEMGYKSELANERQTGIISSKIDDFRNANQFGQFNLQTTIGNQIQDTRNALVNGFANIGYSTAQQTCDLKTNSNDNTQRIIDVLNNHWQSDLQQKYADAKLELSQLAQNAYLVNALKTT